MSGFGGSIKLTGEAAYRQALQAIAADLKNVAAQQKLTAATYDKSDNSLTALSKRSDELKNKLAAQQEKVKTLTNALKDYQSQQEKNKTTIQGLQQQLDKEKQKLEQIAQQYGTTSKEYIAQAKVVNDLEKQLKELNTQYEKNETAVKKTQAALTSAEADVKKTGAAMQKLGQQAQEAGVGADNLGLAVDQSGKKAEAAATGGYTVFKNVLANLATQVINRVIDGVKSMANAVYDAGVSFDSGMSRVEAISGASGEALDKLTEKAKEMGATTKFTATEATNALYYMAMAGWKAEDMLAGLDGVMNLAAASGEDLSRVSDIVTDALTAMGYTADQSSRFADVLAAATANANVSVDTMGATFKYVGAVAGSFGYSMEDVAASIALLGNSGIKAEMAGTALRSIMMRLATDTGKATQAANKLGVAITNSDGQMRDWSDVLTDLRGAFKNLSDEQKSQYAKTIAGTEAMNGFLVLMNSTEEDVNKVTTAINNSTGAADKMAKTMMNNVGGKLTKLRSQLESVYLTIWQKVEPVISKTIDSISRSLKTVNWDKFGEAAGEALQKVADGFKWLLEHKDLVANAIKLIIGAFVASKILSFAQSLSNVITNLAGVAKGTLAYSTALGGLTAAQTANTTATGAAAAAVRLFNAAWAANPIGVVVTGLTLLAGGIMAVSSAMQDTPHAKFMKEMEEQKKAIEEARNSWDTLKEAQQNQINQSMTEITKYQVLKNELDGLIDKNGKVKQGYEDRANFIVTTLQNAFGIEIGMQNGVVEGYDKISEAIDGMIEKQKAQAILQAQEAAYTEAVNNRAQAVETLDKTYADYTEKFKAYEKMQQDYGTNLQQITLLHGVEAAKRYAQAQEEFHNAEANYNAQTELLREYTHTISQYEDNLVKFHEGNYAEMTTVTWDFIKEQQSAGDAQAAQLQKNVDNEKSYGEWLVKQYQKTGDEVYNTQKAESDKRLQQHEKNLQEYLSTTKNGLADNGKEWLENATTVLSMLSGKKIEFKEAADGLVQMYVDGVEEGEPMAKDKAGDITRTVLSELDAQVEAEGYGKNVITGFTRGEGNLSLQNAAYRVATTFCGTIMDRFKKALGIGSPSKITKQYGKWLLKGLGLGMEDEEDQILDQAQGFGENLMDTLNGALSEGVSTDVLRNLQAAIPSEFDANISANTARMAQAAQKADTSLVAQFKQALSQMKIEMDDREMGKFVDATVTDLIYN